MLLPGLVLMLLTTVGTRVEDAAWEPVRSPDWVRHVTRMVYLTPGELDVAEKVGAQVIHTNVVWPYYPLRREGGGLNQQDAQTLRQFVTAAHARGMKVVLGLPPFPSVATVRAHPDWRVHPDPTGAPPTREPSEDDLGTRIGCNQGPWGDYLVELLVELLVDYDLDGYSFDGNYHPPVCYCPACQAAYLRDSGVALPARVDLNDVGYRRYLVWRGERLEVLYRTMQRRLKAVQPDAVVMTWTTNAGRYGHLLTSPRVMSTRMNLLIDLPMQEWWLDETNLGSSVAPAFGVAYLRGIMGGRASASEPYLMARGNPYGSDSFPAHERRTRALLALTHGAQAPQAIWLRDGLTSMRTVFEDVRARAPYLSEARPLPWAAMLVSEQTRQFYAYADIAERFLPHVYGVFRAALEEHRPLDLINDWDLTPERLSRYQVLILPNAAALSQAQVEAVRQFVTQGGGLVATGETSLCDELGQPRQDFALADLFGMHYQGRPGSKAERAAVDANFAITLDDRYWQERTGVARLSWTDHELWRDPTLESLVPARSAIFKGPLVAVSEPAESAEVVARYRPEGADRDWPAIVSRRSGQGRVIYLAAGLDAALWSYAYPYQRRMLDRAIGAVAAQPAPFEVLAPRCVQAVAYQQPAAEGERTVIHLFNDLNSTGGHGLPRNEVPLREEAVPIAGIRVRFRTPIRGRIHLEPGAVELPVRPDGEGSVVELPPLEIQSLLVVEPVR